MLKDFANYLYVMLYYRRANYKKKFDSEWRAVLETSDTINKENLSGKKYKYCKNKMIDGFSNRAMRVKSAVISAQI